MGANISKCYSSFKSLWNDFKLLVNFLLLFWIFEFWVSDFWQMISFSLTWDSMEGNCLLQIAFELLQTSAEFSPQCSWQSTVSIVSQMTCFRAKLTKRWALGASVQCIQRVQLSVVSQSKVIRHTSVFQQPCIWHIWKTAGRRAKRSNVWG